MLVGHSQESWMQKMVVGCVLVVVRRGQGSTHLPEGTFSSYFREDLKYQVEVAWVGHTKEKLMTTASGSLNLFVVILQSKITPQYYSLKLRRVEGDPEAGPN